MGSISRTTHIEAELAAAISVKGFDATGDGVTDDTLAIQAAVDHALENKLPVVVMPAGNYKTSDTIHLGYGVGCFHTVQLVGECSYSFTGTGKPSSQISPTFKDRPVINIAGGRNSGVRNILIAGQTPIANPQGQHLAYRADAANYVPAGAKDDPSAPFCGVCIDGYAGAEPPNPYPTPSYPAYLGEVTGSYDRWLSSDIFVENCAISDTLIGVMCQPNRDGNGDFLHCAFTRLTNLKIGVCWGNSQARCTDLSNVNLYCVHTCFQSTGYGHGVGNMAGNWSNIHINTAYRVIYGHGGWSLGFAISNLYLELGMILGDIEGTGVNWNSCTFDLQDCEGSGDFITRWWKEPTWKGPAEFHNCVFRIGMFFHFQGDCRFSHCAFAAGNNGPVYPTAPSKNMQRALDMFGRVIVEPGEVGRNAARPRFTQCSMHGIMDGATRTGPYSYDNYDNYRCTNIYSMGSDEFAFFNYDFPVLARISNVSMGNVTEIVGNAFKFDPDGPHFDQFKPGDVIYMPSQRSWWYVDAQDAAEPYTVTARALTGFTYDGTGWTTPPTGTPYYIPRGVLDLNVYDAVVPGGLFLKTLAGSPVVDVVKADGAPQQRPVALTTDSKPFFYLQPTEYTGNTVPFPRGSYVDSVDATSFTMRANALCSGVWLYAPGIKRIA